MDVPRPHQRHNRNTIGCMVEPRDCARLVCAVRGALASLVWRLAPRQVGNPRRAVDYSCKTELTPILGLERGSEPALLVFLSSGSAVYDSLCQRPEEIQRQIYLGIYIGVVRTGAWKPSPRARRHHSEGRNHQR